MVADKFARNVAGVMTEVAGVVTATGNAIPALDSTGRLAVAQLPVGVGPEVQTMPTSETLAAGNLVNVYNATGVLTARNADASTVGKEANGFVKELFTHPTTATVYMFGGASNTAATCATIGARQYLATTPGATVETAPTYASGARFHQYVGKAISLTELAAEAHDYTVLSA